jgi:hypothetical protein
VAQWTEEESLQLIEIYKTNAILWDPKHINYYKKNLKWDAWRDIGCAMGRCAERRVFLFHLFKLAIIKAAKLTATTTSREDITTKA